MRYLMTNYDDVLSNFMIEINGKFPNLKSYQKNDNGVNITIFHMNLLYGDKLCSLWGEINSEIALYFQTELEKPIDRWNIYLVFISSEIIESDLKYIIEQDKYCTRKIIYDGVEIDKEENMEKYIDKKLFELEFKSNLVNSNKKISIKKSIEKIYPKLIKIIENEDFSKYLEGDSNENKKS